jgi:drug/metabolite transporter (DMT)-like permease
MLILKAKKIWEVSKDAITLHKPKRMLYLLLCILSSTVVLITFKLLNHFSVNNFSAIIINYLAASVAGFFLAKGNLSGFYQLGVIPILLMVTMGILFITMFHFLGKSTQTAGVAITSVSAKMSVIIPILVSVLIDPNDKLNAIRIAGIVLALVAVLLLVIPRKTEKFKPVKTYLPLIIFLGIGMVDASVKVAQQYFVTNELNPLFNAVVFAMAGIAGLLLLPFNAYAAKDLQKIKTWLLGALLGLANFGSMFFMVAALNHVGSKGTPMEGSVLFGINNLGVVLAGTLVGLLLFGERPSKTNLTGIALSVLAIVILMQS